MLKPIKETSIRVRRRFDQTFKREAVQNWLASGKSAQVIAKELGLLPNRLYVWRRRLTPADPGGKGSAGVKSGSLADLQGQLDAAQREIRHLREQRDILKKTLGILSEPSPNAMNGSTP
jgi:transposase-like protein